MRSCAWLDFADELLSVHCNHFNCEATEKEGGRNCLFIEVPHDDELMPEPCLSIARSEQAPLDTCKPSNPLNHDVTGSCVNGNHHVQVLDSKSTC